MTTPDNVLDSPALPLLLRLEHSGFDLLAQGDRLFLRPEDRLTPALRAEIRPQRNALLTLVRCCDDGVQQRVEAYRAQLEAVPDVRGPFLFLAGVPYTRGVCFSCAAALPVLEFGRCSRCSLGWRLALRLEIAPEHATALDTAREVDGATQTRIPTYQAGAVVTA